MAWYLVKHRDFTSVGTGNNSKSPVTVAYPVEERWQLCKSAGIIPPVITML
jgi:hypothetical protein